MRALSIPVLAVCMCLLGCGTPGAPMPPSLGIPKPVTDLQGVRKGSTVTLTWSAPAETVDGELIRKPGKMVVLRGVRGAKPQAVQEVPLEPSLNEHRQARVSATDSVAGVLQNPGIGDFITYSVSAQSHSGRADGDSNNIQVPTVPTLPPPQALQFTLTAEGVSLSWEISPPPPSASELKPQYLYRIRRRDEQGQEFVTLGQVPPTEGGVKFLDKTMDWEKHYEYWVTPVTLWEGDGRKGEIEGEDSSPVSVFVHDTFPPAVPTGLQAVFSGLVQQPGIDLTWTPNSDADLAGYNVYRLDANGQPAKINAELVKTPAFHDPYVQAGGKYVYAVTAVDLRGNESGRSAEASESVPK
jgi:hypothetical protein